MIDFVKVGDFEDDGVQDLEDCGDTVGDVERLVLKESTDNVTSDVLLCSRECEREMVLVFERDGVFVGPDPVTLVETDGSDSLKALDAVLGTLLLCDCSTVPERDNEDVMSTESVEEILLPLTDCSDVRDIDTDEVVDGVRVRDNAKLADRDDVRTVRLRLDVVDGVMERLRDVVLEGCERD